MRQQDTVQAFYDLMFTRTGELPDMNESPTSAAPITDDAHRPLGRAEVAPVHIPIAGPTVGPGAQIIGDPLALGLASFGVSVGVVGIVNAGLVDARTAPVTYAVMIASGFVTQLIAGLLGFRRGETFAGVVFTVFAGFWLGVTLLLAFWAPMIAKAGGSVGDGLGLFLLAWAIISTFIWIASMATTTMNIVVFGVGTASLYVLAVAGFAGSGGLAKIGGWLQIITGVGLFYLSAAAIVNEIHGRRVIPVF
jgi:succinate-acetate transporter protein